MSAFRDAIGRDQREAAEAARVLYTFLARHEGTCQRCGDDIAVGEQVAKLASGAYVCRGCTP